MKRQTNLNFPSAMFVVLSLQAMLVSATDVIVWKAWELGDH